MTEERSGLNDNPGQASDELAEDIHGVTVVANGSDHTDEHQSSDAIKADIEQTRNEMSQTINQLQERLSPTRLKEQAQETVRSAISDSTDALVHYVQGNAGAFGYTVVDTIKHNPVPAALVGIGLGWLIFKSLSSPSSDEQNDAYRPRDSAGRNRGYGDPEYSRRYSSDYGAQSRYAYEAGGDRGTQYQGGQYQRGSRYVSGQNPGYIAQGAYTSGSVESVGRSSGEQGQSRVGQVVQTAQDKASDVLGQARDTAEQLTNQAQETAQQAGQYVQDKVGQVREQASQLGEQAQQTLQDTGRQVQRTVESNPVAFGVAALVAGVLIGLVLPETQTENQVMGEKRDQLLDSAQAVAQDVKQRVQTIVDEKMPEVKQTAQRVADDLKQTGKSAAEDLKQTLQDTGESLKQGAHEMVQTGKEAATDVAQTGKSAANDLAQTDKAAPQDAMLAIKKTSPPEPWSTPRTGSVTGAGTEASAAPEEEGSTKNDPYKVS
jgi:gas vesicle protein